MLGTMTCFTKTDGQVSSLTCQEQEKKAGTIWLQVQNSQVVLTKACNTITMIS